MKSLLKIGLVVLALSIGQVSVAQANDKPARKSSTKSKAPKKRANKSKAKKTAAIPAGKVKQSEVASGAKLQTDISFNDSTLHGRYQTPDEANIKVENEKVLRDLLAVRTNFKDRLKKSSEQN